MADDDIAIAIAGQLAEHGADPLSLVNDEGSVFMAYKGFSGAAGFLWLIKSAEFTFEAGGSNEYFHVSRNGVTVRVDAPVGTPFKVANIAIAWKVDRIGLHVQARVEGPDPPGPNFTDSRECLTPATHVPNRIVGWLRRQLSKEKLTYADEGEFRSTVGWALRFLQDVLRSVGAQPVLWDKSFEGRKIVGRKPKAETECQAWAHSALFSVAAARNLTVARSSAAASGELDFLITAPLKDGATAKACVEFKLAHATNLFHGLTVQLPTYMKAVGCDFGVFVILNFSCAEFPEPKDVEALRMEVERRRMEAGLPSIHVIVIDCSLPRPPSTR